MVLAFQLQQPKFCIKIEFFCGFKINQVKQTKYGKNKTTKQKERNKPKTKQINKHTCLFFKYHHPTKPATPNIITPRVPAMNNHNKGFKSKEKRDYLINYDAFVFIYLFNY
jgi:hypothetical protein